MLKIKLTQNHYAIVDDEDYEWLSRHKWYYFNGCAARQSNHHIYMSREIVKAPKGLEVDHKNGDRLDNRKANLRICEKAENLRNRTVKQKNNTSGYKGVFCMGSKWISQIRYKSKLIYLGVFNSPIIAARAYDKAALLYFGEFARLNL